MTTYTKFKEYIWLVNTIYQAKSITFAEINERWLNTEMSEGVEMSRTTFYRHKCAIEDIFGIYIDCDKKNGNWYDRRPGTCHNNTEAVTCRSLCK